MDSKVYPSMTEEQLLQVAEAIGNVNKQQKQVGYLTMLVDQYTEELAWETNKLVDMQALLDSITPNEGQTMPYMYCNHAGCNETVKLPNKYCAKHNDINALKDTTHLDLLDKANKTMNTKKTTK